MSPAVGAPPRRPAAPAPARPPLDPRIGRRRAEVTRRQGRRRLWLALAALLLSGAALGAWALLHSSVFSARVVTVVGSANTPTARVVAVAGLADHPPLLDVDPAAVARRVESLPWVSRARVQKEWPDGVRIKVTEARPVAAVALVSAKGTPPGHWALIDRARRVLADVGVQPAALPLLAVTKPPGGPGTWLPTTATPALDVAATLPRAFAAQVTTVVVGKGGQVSLDLTTPVTVLIGNTSQLPKKYEDVAAVLAEAKLVAGDTINVTAPGSIVVSQR